MKNNKNNALLALSSAHFALDMYAALLIPLYPFIAQKLDITIASISFVIAVGHSVSSILQPFFGYISDKINHRFFMFWGLIFASVFMPLGLNAKNSYMLTIFLILGMIGNALYHPQVTVMIKNFYPSKNFVGAMGLFLGLGTIGYAISPYFSAYIFQYHSACWKYLSLIGIFIAFFLLIYVPKIKNFEKTNIKINFWGAIKDIFKNKLCMFLILTTVAKAGLVMTFGTYMPFILKKYGFLPDKIGFILTLFYLAGGISMIISSKIEKYLKLKGMIFLSYFPILPLIALMLLCFNYSDLIAVILFIISGFFVLLSAGVVLAYAQNIIPKHSGSISGIIQGFTLAIASLLLIPFGFVGQIFGVEYILIIISLFAFIIATITLKIDLK
ncbi:MFS transporter [bacterium]|nr:MFS transporter [bacterium]